VAAVGDMLFDRQVKALIKSSGGEAPLAHVATHLSAADVTVGNLETPLATSGTRNPVKEPKYAFRGDPAAIDGLKASGFDAVSLANNHALDYGPDALAETIASLDQSGIGHAGAGANSAVAWAPATVTLADGTRVAYLAFTQIVPPGYLASADRAGVASARSGNRTVTDAVKAAKKDHDYVLVSFHWGVEYESTATAGQVALAHKAIDAGADMVLAHHPHVIQGVEFYKDRLIAYSLGDFVFDHYSRETGESFILDAQLGPDGVTNATATPVYLDAHGAPEYVQGKHAETILTRLKSISKRLGATVEIDGAKARLMP
jgi:poly-gamma-glutamate synthesis protein (capsule biosynthesis protein)